MVTWSKGSIPSLVLLGILKRTPLLQGRNHYYLPGAIKYVPPGHFYFLSLHFYKTIVRTGK